MKNHFPDPPLTPTDKVVEGQPVVLVGQANLKGTRSFPHEKDIDWTKRYDGPRTFWGKVCDVCKQTRHVDDFRVRISVGFVSTSSRCNKCEKQESASRHRRKKS